MPTRLLPAIFDEISGIVAPGKGPGSATSPTVPGAAGLAKGRSLKVSHYSERGQTGQKRGPIPKLCRQVLFGVVCLKR